MKLTISDSKSGKSYSVEADEKTTLLLLGKKIKDEIDLSFIEAGLRGVITGGSNKQGFPMISTLDQSGSKRILLTSGIGFRPTRKGERRKKRVVGRIIDNSIQQVNLKIISGTTNTLEEKYKKVKEENKEESIPKPISKKKWMYDELWLFLVDYLEKEFKKRSQFNMETYMS